MRILNLRIDDLYLLSELNGANLEIALGKSNNIVYPNKVYVQGDNLYDDCVFENHFMLDFVDNVPKLVLNEDEDTAEKLESTEKYNLLFSSVLSVDGESLLNCVKVWGDENLVAKTELLAIGVRPCTNRALYPLALLKIDKRCDYEINGVIYSCSNGDTLLKTEHKNCYNVEELILSCLAGKLGNRI